MLMGGSVRLVGLAYSTQGYTTMMYKAGDFQYAYYLWFQDSDGCTLTPDEVCPLALATAQPPSPPSTCNPATSALYCESNCL